MLQLHLSRYLLTSMGVVVAFVSLPSSLTKIDHNTIIEPLRAQSIRHEARPGNDRLDKKEKPVLKARKSQTDFEPGLAAPIRLVSKELDSWDLPEQSSEDLFLALNSQAARSRRVVPIPVVAFGAKKLTPAQKKAAIKPIVGSANRVVVPSVGIDIGVKIGRYDVASGTWGVSDGSAFYADTTVPVNNSNGTTLIYGHAKWGMFGTLPDIRPGAEVTVYTTEGIRFVYSFESLRQVKPTDTSLLTVEGKPRLLLQTCSGFFDQYRTLALFKLKQVVRS